MSKSGKRSMPQFGTDPCPCWHDWILSEGVIRCSKSHLLSRIVITLTLLRCSNEIMEGYLHRKPPHSFTIFTTDEFYWSGWADVFQSQRERWKKCSCNAESLRKEIYESMSSATKKYNLSRRNADWLNLSGNFLPSFPSLSRKGPLPLLRKLYPKHDRGLFPDLLGLF